jgi:PAS domain S-box-containing protein
MSNSIPNIKRRGESTVLVVNDNKEQSELINTVLRKAGYRVYIAHDGKEGFELAQHETPDLLISDVVMPNGDGIELCRRLRNDPNLRSIPILLVSGVLFNTDNVVEGLRAGADDYLEMPFNAMNLIARVSRLIERSHLEAHYREIVEQASDIIYTHDLTGKLTSINIAGARFLGKSPEDLIGIDAARAFQVKDNEGFIHKTIEELEQGDKLRKQVEVRSGEGQTYWLEMSLTPIRDRHGKTIGVRSVARDITLRKLAIRSLEESEQRYRSLFEQNPDAVFSLDLLGNFVTANSACEKIWGYTVDELLLMNVLSLVVEEDKARTSDHIERAVQGEPQACEIAIISRDGRRVEVNATYLPIVVEGEIVGVYGIAKDITEKIEANRILSELVEIVGRGKREWEQTFDAMHDAVILYDTEHRVLRVNKATESLMFPLTVQQATGRLWCMFPHEDNGSSCPIHETINTGEQVLTQVFHNGNSEGRIYALSASPLRSNKGEIVGAVTIYRDITEEHRRAEREAESDKMRSLGQLAAGVAHDFNNSLAVVLGRVQLLLRKADTDWQKRSLQVIETAARDAAETVRRIQTFAQKDPSNQLSLVSVGRLITDSINLTRTRWEDDARARGLSYQVHFSPSTNMDDRVEANPSELREVFVNLIFNALDAMPNGGNIFLREKRTTDSVIVEIQDTGRGIPSDIKDRIFEPFFTTKGPQGTGLGLSVSYGIINRYGGRLEVESEIGRGATFLVQIPITHSTPTTVPEPDQVKIPQHHILVVDDEDSVRDVLVEMLNEFDQKVTAVSSGEEALNMFSKESFDILITDLSMPAMDGLTLACKVRESAPKTKILLTTGYGQDVSNTSAVEAIDLMVSKPFQISDLQSALMTLLDNQ